MKIGDFGSAMPNGRNIPTTTPGYSAPEITGNKLPNKKPNFVCTCVCICVN